jgi:hypothetical protein
MAGITSAITIEDRFSKTIKLFTGLISGSVGPVEALTQGVGMYGNSIKTMLPFVTGLYDGFDNFRSILGLTNMSFGEMMKKANNVEAVLQKVAVVFPQFAPFVGILSTILGKLGAGQNLLSVGVNLLDQFNLPFSGVIKGIMKVREFLNSGAAKLIKLVAVIGAIALAMKGVWGALKLIEYGGPKAFKSMMDGIKSIPGKLMNLDARLTLNSEGYAKARAIIGKHLSGVIARLKLYSAAVKYSAQNGSNQFKDMQFKASLYLAALSYKYHWYKNQIRDTDAYKKASKGITDFMTFAKGRWDWYSGIARANIKKATDALKETAAYKKGMEIYNQLAYKYSWYMGMLKNTQAYQTAAKGFATISDTFSSLKKKIIATILVQKAFLLSCIKEKGITGGIEAYLKCTWALQKAKLALTLTSIKTYAIMKLSALKAFIATKIAGTSAFKTLVGGFKMVFQKAKETFSKLPGVVKAGLAVYGIIKAVKAMKSAFDAMSGNLDKAKEKVEELIEKTAEIERSKRFAMRFGKEAAAQFQTMATKMSISMGIVKNDILAANTAFKNMGVSDKTNAELTKLSARFSTLNENMDFSAVSGAIADAIKSGSADSLGELFNGNPRALKEMKRKHLDRLLDRGKVDEFIERLTGIADKFGYTQEKADELMETPQGKLKRISANIDRLSAKLKSTFTMAILPYIEKALAFIQSPEFQANFELIRRRITGIINICGGIVEKIVDIGQAAYTWWLEPTGGVLRNIMLFMAVAGGLKKLIAIFKGIAASSTFIGIAFRFVGKGMKGAFKGGITGAKFLLQKIEGIKTGFKGAESAAKKFGRTVKAVAKVGGKALSGMVLAPEKAFIGLVTLIAVGCKALVTKLTGESHGFVESVVEVIVGGLVTGFGYMSNSIVGTWNDIIDAVADGIDFMAEMFEGVANKLVEAFFWAKNKVFGLFGEDEEISIIPKADFGRIDRKALKGSIYSDEFIHSAAQDAVDSVMGMVPGIMDFANNAMDIMGLGEGYGEEWERLVSANNEQLNEQNDNLRGIRRNTDDMRHKMDLQWMKELAEQRFVNNVNVRQLTPTVNVKVSGTKSTPQDTADALAKELNQMAKAGAFNAYGARA